jgi:hypothetical protein
MAINLHRQMQDLATGHVDRLPGTHGHRGEALVPRPARAVRGAVKQHVHEMIAADERHRIVVVSLAIIDVPCSRRADVHGEFHPPEIAERIEAAIVARGPHDRGIFGVLKCVEERLGRSR